MTSRITKIIGRSQRATLFLVILIATVLIVSSILIVVQKGRTSATRKINYSELYKIAEIGSAASVIVENDSLIVKSTDGSVFQATVAGDSFRQGVVELFRKNGVPIEFSSMQPSLAETLFTYSAPVVIFLLLGFIGWRVYATVNGRSGNFSLMDHSGKQNVTFADVGEQRLARSGRLAASSYAARPERARRCSRAPLRVRQAFRFFRSQVRVFRRNLPA